MKKYKRNCGINLLIVEFGLKMDRHPRLLSVIMSRVSLFDRNVLSGACKSIVRFCFLFFFDFLCIGKLYYLHIQF